MNHQVIYIQFGGVWKKNEGVYKWSPYNEEVTSIFVEKSNIKYQEFTKKLYEKFGVNKNEIELKMSYVPDCEWLFPPVTIRSDECLSCYLYECGKQPYKMLLCVELIKKDGSEKGHKECEIEENEIIPYDNYEDNITMEECCGDVVPTPINTRGNDGCDVRESCLPPPPPPEDGLEVLECHEQGEIIVPNSSDEAFSFTDESNLAIGQEFENKEEVKVKLNDIALKACFEMVIKKSTKSLYVVKCIDSSCKWAVRAARIPNSERFSIRTYCNTHTCSPVNQKRKNRHASVALVAKMVKSHFEGQKEIPNPKEIMTMMKSRNVEISYWKAWRGKQLAQDLLMGSTQHHTSISDSSNNEIRCEQNNPVAT